MAVKIRVLDAANKTMQRLGYLKALSALVNETETSNFTTLGKRFIDRVLKSTSYSPPFEDSLKEYARMRMMDGTYREIRKKILDENQQASISIELQDVYLSDPALPSSTGKLVEGDWRHYPYWGTSLDLIKQGTYSSLTRSLVLLMVTPKAQLKAFQELDRDNNPLAISDAQSLILLYCMIDNDAEIIFPLFNNILAKYPGEFLERQASELLPEILRGVDKKFRNAGIPLEDRKRLSTLIKTADTIDKWKGKSYSGGGAPQATVRVRLEPYCDMGIIDKTRPDRYEYQTTHAMHTLIDNWQSVEETDNFLQDSYFQTFALGRKIESQPATDQEATVALSQAGRDLKSSLGYSPIIDVGLLAGTRLLTEKKRVLELGRATDLLKKLQKQDPTFVRFTVDRMGALAYVKFLKEAPEVKS